MLFFDLSRDLDLDTREYVDLEDVANIINTYNLCYNLVILLSLFAMLQYTGVDDRMAMLTRSIGESGADLLPFTFLFMLFVVVFGTIGHLLYGPLLTAFTPLTNAIVTSVASNHPPPNFKRVLQRELTPRAR